MSRRLQLLSGEEGREMFETKNISGEIEQAIAWSEDYECYRRTISDRKSHQLSLVFKNSVF